MSHAFENSVPEPEQAEVQNLLSDLASGKELEEAIVFDISWASPERQIINGSLRWKGRDHSFSLSVINGSMASILSWNEISRSTLAPIDAIVSDASRKGRSAFLLEKWDDLIARSDVAALLRRFDRESFQDPRSEAVQSLRDRVASLGFEIVSHDKARALRHELETTSTPTFKSIRHG